MGILLGGLAVLVGIYLFRGARLAIGLSALGAAFVAIAAAVAAPAMRGPVILALGVFALAVGGYAALAAGLRRERFSADRLVFFAMWPPELRNTQSVTRARHLASRTPL